MTTHYEDDVIDIVTDDLPEETKPDPIIVDIAGRDYTLHWSKDHFWISYFAAYHSNNGGVLLHASMELLEVSLGAGQWQGLAARLRNMHDPLDTVDLMTAVTEMTNEWQEYAISRMEDLGVAIPEKLKKNLNRKERRAQVKAKPVGKGKKVLSSPSSKAKGK